MGMMDIWRNLNPLERDFTHYSATHNVHSRIYYFFINKVDGYRVTECIIGGADVSDHNTLFLKLHLNARKRQTIWRLNVGMLNNKSLVEELKKEIGQYMEDNSNGEVDPHIVWDALKAVVRGKVIAKTSKIKKLKAEAYQNHSLILRELEQQYQKTNNPNICKKIRDTKTKINDILMDEYGKNNIFMKQNYYEIGPRATKLLAKRIQKQQAVNTIHTIKDPCTNETIDEPENIERVFRGFYEKLYTQPAAVNEEEIRTFLNELDLPSIGT